VDEYVCVEQLRLNRDGSIDGETIFVRTDCGTRMPLGKDKQDPVYQKPGVPLDRGLQESWALTWEKNDLYGMDDKDITCNTSEKSPSVEDCLPVLNSSTTFPDGWVSAGLKGKSWWPEVFISSWLLLHIHADSLTVPDWLCGCFKLPVRLVSPNR
jgi:hypothetical protein